MRLGLNFLRVPGSNRIGDTHHTHILSSDQDAAAGTSPVGTLPDQPSLNQLSPTPRSAVLPFLRRMAYRQIFRQGLPLIVAAAFLLILIRQLDHLDLITVFAMTREVTPQEWVLALIFTAVSFLAIGRYDALVHRMLGTGVSARRASQAGIVAIAVSQTTGFGLITGALSRFRMLPEISLWKATQLTAVVAVTFLSGWVVAASVTLLVAGWFSPSTVTDLSELTLSVIISGITVLILSIIASLIQPRSLPIGTITKRVSSRLHKALPRVINLPDFPPLATLFSVFTLTLVDTFASCGALWILLPEAANPGFLMLAPIFLLAFGLGLICGSPAGVGPFEVALFALLPLAADGPLLAGILAWRLIYYIIPALLGIAALTFSQRNISPAREGLLGDGANHMLPKALLIDNAPFAEAGLVWQGQIHLACAPGDSVSLMIGETGQTITALRDPLSAPCPETALQVLTRSARARGKIPCLYKCSARMAQAARKQGWKVFRVAEEAWISPATWDRNTPAHRGLRRKLRKAQKAGVYIEEANHFSRMELHEITEINSAWVQKNGGERGFSMGRFCPDHLKRQKLFIARESGKITAFTSFHHNQKEWALDLMRQEKGCSDGTMPALIEAALQAAAKAGVPRLSLAAMPCTRPKKESKKDGPARPNIFTADPRLTLWHRFAAFLQDQGLRQFKLSFAPNVTPLYMAAPSWGVLTLAGGDILRAIAHPPPLKIETSKAHNEQPAPAFDLSSATSGTPEYLSKTHNDYEFFNGLKL